MDTYMVNVTIFKTFKSIVDIKCLIVITLFYIKLKNVAINFYIDLENKVTLPKYI